MEIQNAKYNENQIHLLRDLDTASNCLDRALRNYNIEFPNHTRFFEIDFEEILGYVIKARRAIMLEVEARTFDK